MRQLVKRIIINATATLILMLGLVNFANAGGSCGGGVILEINEGGWAGNNHVNTLLIKLAYDEDRFPIGLPNSTYNDGFIRFDGNSLSSVRLDNIRRLAYLAFASGKPVRVWASGSTCRAASDLTIIAH